MVKWTDIVTERKRLEKAYQVSLEKLKARCPHEHTMQPFVEGGKHICLDCGKELIRND